MLVTACGSTKPSSTTLAGQWTVTTARHADRLHRVGRSKVTAITVGYRFGGCAGTQTFDNLNLDAIRFLTSRLAIDCQTLENV